MVSRIPPKTEWKLLFLAGDGKLAKHVAAVFRAVAVRHLEIGLVNRIVDIPGEARKSGSVVIGFNASCACSTGVVGWTDT